MIFLLEFFFLHQDVATAHSSELPRRNLAFRLKFANPNTRKRQGLLTIWHQIIHYVPSAAAQTRMDTSGVIF
jgi:hypothetical protein